LRDCSSPRPTGRSGGRPLRPPDGFLWCFVCQRTRRDPLCHRASGHWRICPRLRILLRRWSSCQGGDSRDRRKSHLRSDDQVIVLLDCDGCVRLSPREGSHSPRKGSHSPREGNHSPPEVSHCPQEGRRSPREVSHSPGEGSRSPPEGRSSPPKGNDSPAEGRGAAAGTNEGARLPRRFFDN
jgi:hypothetical protein